MDGCYGWYAVCEIEIFESTMYVLHITYFISFEDIPPLKKRTISAVRSKQE